MKKVIGIAAAATLCVVSGMAVAKNPDATVNEVFATGSVQGASTVSSPVIAQRIEGQYSSTLAVGVGHGITGGVGQGITGGVGQGITGGVGQGITGGVGQGITGGVGQGITGGVGHGITGGVGQGITGGVGQGITGGVGH